MKYQTEQRKLMHAFFAEHPHEMYSAKEIAAHLDKTRISISAVYRSLTELENEGVIYRRAKNGGRGFYYQYADSESCREHIHLICKKCGKIQHMDLSDTKKLAGSTLQHEDFLLDRRESILYGTCGTCRR